MKIRSSAFIRDRLAMRRRARRCGDSQSVANLIHALDESLCADDAQWAKMEPHCLGKPTDPGRSGRDNRRFEAVLWIARTGSPWRDLPAMCGNWSTAFRRYSDWRKADVFVRLFKACSDEPDMEYAMIDATIVKVHHHGQGAKATVLPGKRRFEFSRSDMDRVAFVGFGLASLRACHVNWWGLSNI
ncbi:transposase [Acidisoma sp. S159]|uniref:transposase n=1 Tax=Acidisoma sp. S159 TaxID=1747225 RepID=UPI001C20ACE8